MLRDSSSDFKSAVETENNPNIRKKKKCNCRKDCKTGVCSCNKFAAKCISSCLCQDSHGNHLPRESKCKNVFQDLTYFFGDSNSNDQVIQAHPCFANYLRGHGENEFKSIDRDELRKRLLNAAK